MLGLWERVPEQELPAPTPSDRPRGTSELEETVLRGLRAVLLPERVPLLTHEEGARQGPPDTEEQAEQRQGEDLRGPVDHTPAPPGATGSSKLIPFHLYKLYTVPGHK